jgi:hypothetical protein
MEPLFRNSNFVNKFNDTFSKQLTQTQADQVLLFAVSAIKTPEKILPYLPSQIKNLCLNYSKDKQCNKNPELLIDHILNINPLHLIAGIKYLGLQELFFKIYMICPHSSSASNSFRGDHYRYHNISKLDAVEWYLEHKPNANKKQLLQLEDYKFQHELTNILKTSNKYDKDFNKNDARYGVVIMEDSIEELVRVTRIKILRNDSKLTEIDLISLLAQGIVYKNYNCPELAVIGFLFILANQLIPVDIKAKSMIINSDSNNPESGHMMVEINNTHVIDLWLPYLVTADQSVSDKLASNNLFWGLEEYKKAHGEKIGYEKDPVFCTNITKILEKGLLINILRKLNIQDSVEQYNKNLTIMLIVAISVPRKFMIEGKIDPKKFATTHMKFILNIIDFINVSNKDSINKAINEYADLSEDIKKLLLNNLSLAKYSTL